MKLLHPIKNEEIAKLGDTANVPASPSFAISSFTFFAVASYPSFILLNPLFHKVHHGFYPAPSTDIEGDDQGEGGQNGTDQWTDW
jgi:hypothetical protein